MASVATGDRTATRDEVLACRGQLRNFAHRHGLLDPRVDDVGTVIVRSSEPGYGLVRRFASEASTHVGVWANVITAEVSAAQVVAEPLCGTTSFAGNLAERISRRPLHARNHRRFKGLVRR